MRHGIIIVGVLALVVSGGTYVGFNRYLNQVKANAAHNVHVVIPKVASLGVLVAANKLDPGKTLDSTMITWQLWPESIARAAAASGVVTSDPAGESSAQAPFIGAVSRTTIFKGEPITDDKVVHKLAGSVLSEILAPGQRSMTITVDPTIGAGGMLQPGDRVDIMLTVPLAEANSGQIDPDTGRQKPTLSTETIMSDVKVIAVDRRFAASSDPATPAPTTVTFEVTPQQAEQLVTANRIGRFTLMMRPLADGPSPKRVGLGFTTEVNLMPNTRAALENTQPKFLDPNQNPFYLPLKPVAAKPVAAKPDAITVYRFTTQSTVELGANGFASSPTAGGAPPGSSSAPTPAVPLIAAPPKPVQQPSIVVVPSADDGYYGRRGASSSVGSP
jgi:pilus assembly protein CpaB